jgi:hypothetical protein
MNNPLNDPLEFHGTGRKDKNILKILWILSKKKIVSDSIRRIIL